MIYSDAPQSVLNFLSYKGTIQGRSVKTVSEYYLDLRYFFRFVLKSKYQDKYEKISVEDIDFSDCTDEDVTEVTYKDIYNFLFYLQQEKGNGESARARKLCAIKNLYKFLKNTYEISENPADKLEAPRKKKKLPKYLTLEEAQTLLASITPPNYERDYAIITLFLNCGLRVSEMAGISLKDIDPDMTKLKVTGKGSKERIIYLNDACRIALKAYLGIRPNDIKSKDSGALFISRNRNRLSVKTIQWLVYKRLKEAGLEGREMSVHKLRHTAATLMYQHGHTDVRVLKDILGHEDLSTTQIYTHLSDAQMQKAADNNPLSGLKPQKPVKKIDTDEA
ncbi:MAG: tyrosine recombinase XerC [Ruminococcaceae bacterium]|nr:tyrosine recombinase XerC [Oscillospiraceae bacterium]